MHEVFLTSRITEVLDVLIGPEWKYIYYLSGYKGISSQSELENSTSDMGKIQITGELRNNPGSMPGHYCTRSTDS